MTVTLNIFKKPEWGSREWKIYINNLKILSRSNNLKQQEFSGIIGVKNAFRKDIGRPDKRTVSIICDKFAVTETWLSTPRDVKNGILELKIEEKPESFDTEGGWRPQDIEKRTGFPADHEIWRAYKLLHEIYESGEDVYVRAIFSNLVAFHSAAQQKMEIEKNRERLSKVEHVIKFLDRRSGHERRQIVSPNFPAEKERRSGRDRRKTI